MKIAALADVKARLSAYVDECENEGPVIITRNGKAAAVLLAPKDNDDLERLMLAHSRRSSLCLASHEEALKQAKACYKTNSGRLSPGVTEPNARHESEKRKLGS
jgi:prevent-host-death family protein